MGRIQHCLEKNELRKFDNFPYTKKLDKCNTKNFPCSRKKISTTSEIHETLWKIHHWKQKQQLRQFTTSILTFVADNWVALNWRHRTFQLFNIAVYGTQTKLLNFNFTVLQFWHLWRDFQGRIIESEVYMNTCVVIEQLTSVGVSKVNSANAAVKDSQFYN